MDKKTNEYFDIELEDHDKKISVSVHRNETTDGSPFFELELGGKKVQLRKEEQWQVIWGEIPQHEIDRIGRAIDQKIQTSAL
ncbi:hypothetical protein [Pedobacter sp. JY14-1]|uniref:hypothetical protein n=1 Tax=Pedobacter sp. JY14-1 TaxID=3034151 RepID=UPI0023E20A13|nr:hypothetical protein [Pedobacter sp. JY14-1]